MIKAVLFDLDGTLFVGRTAIPGAQEKIDELRSKGIKTLFLTNAATRTKESVAQKMQKMGLKVNKEEIYTSGYFLVRYVTENYPGKKVFVIGEKGLFEELRQAGVETAEDNAGVVAVGLDRQFTYEKLSKALQQLRAGAALVASNHDHQYPVENGFMPGAGSLVAAVETASGKKAYVAGKPNTYGFEVIKKENNLRNDEVMLVGDRLDTDIQFAKNCGIKSALVLTGVSKKDDITKIKPDYVFESIAAFSLP